MATHTVSSGDTLWAISQKYGVGLSDLIAANPSISNPNLIYVGQSITIPNGSGATDPNAGGGTPVTPGGGGNNQAGGGAPNVPVSPPNWNAGTLPASWTAESEYGAFVNAILPWLSPEDQRTFAGGLSRSDQTQYGGMNPTSALYPTPPATLTTDTKRYYQSQERAQAILSALDTKAKASGQATFGPGYGFLQQVVSILRDFGAQGGNGQTRRQQLQMLAALDPLMAEAKSDTLSAYGPVAQAISSPFFSAGQIRPVMKDSTGKWIFGAYNPELTR